MLLIAKGIATVWKRKWRNVVNRTLGAQKLKVRNDSHVPLAFFGTSMLGLLFLALLTFSSSTNTMQMQKQLIVSIFWIICIAGIAAGISPTRCSRIFQHQKTQRMVNKEKGTNTDNVTITFKGHHPTCGSFAAHVIHFGDKIYCAGCTGLMVGAVISLVCSLLYVLSEANMKETSMFLFWVGFAGVACGLFQYVSFAKKASIHFFFDAFFVTGAFLLLLAVNEISNNFVLGLYLLMLILYWIIARIMLSRWEHRRLCSTCSLRTCASFLN